MANKTFNTRIKSKRDTSANWTSKDPVLLNGEIIIVDTASGETRFKIGDGTKKYSQLPFQDEAVRSLIDGKIDNAALNYGLTQVTNDAASKYVSYAAEQNLTEDQQLQAKTNLGIDILTGNTTAITPLQVEAAVRAGRPVSITVTHPEYGDVTFTDFVCLGDVGSGSVFGTVYIQLFTRSMLAALYTDMDDNKSWATSVIEVATADNVESIKSQLNDYVKYTASQNLTDNQKAQARSNIGAISADEISSIPIKHPIILEEDTDYGNTLPSNPVEGQLFFQSANSGLPIVNGGTGAVTAADALANLGGLPITGGRMVNTTTSKGIIDHPGNSSGWGNSRDNAIIRRPDAVTNAGTYFPLVSSKTVNGNWAIGTLSNNIYVNYDSDTDYNAGNNKLTQQFWFGNDGNLYIPNGKVKLANGTLGASASSIVSCTFDGMIYKNLVIFIKSYANSGNLYTTYTIPTIADTWNLFLPTYNDYYRAAATITGSGYGMRCTVQMNSNYSGSICYIYGTM